jgi:hypothetical protein
MQAEGDILPRTRRRMHQITAYPQVSGALAHTRRGPSVRQPRMSDSLGVGPGPQVARSDRREQSASGVEQDRGALDERGRPVLGPANGWRAGGAVSPGGHRTSARQEAGMAAPVRKTWPS